MTTPDPIVIGTATGTCCSAVPKMCCSFAAPIGGLSGTTKFTFGWFRSKEGLISPGWLH